MQKTAFICGAGPLPNEEGVLWQTAYGLRTWQFLQAFIDKKEWEVFLVLLTEQKNYKNARPLKKWVKKDGIHILYLDKDEGGFKNELKKAFKDSNADLCIGVNNLPSFYLAELSSQIPFWADLNGWLMGEAQSAAFVHQDSSYLKTLWQREKKILEKMDCGSVASTPQKEASYGEIATLFRLNHLTEGQEFFHVIPPANELETEKASHYKLDLKSNERAILFCGSYNTWLDEETLFAGLELAMKQNPTLHFMSTGSEADAEGNPVLKNFLAKIQNSEYKHRYHFLGRLEKKDLLAVYEQVLGAINLDRDNLETHFGARNRINEWLHYGVPTLSTAGSEFTKHLAQEKIIFALPFKDPKALSKAIATLFDLDRKSWAETAKKFMSKEYSYKKTLAPFVAWLNAPKIAPDKNQYFSGSTLAKLKFRIKKDGVFFLAKWLLKKLR